MKLIEIYSTPTCHYCHLAKDFFREYGLPFTEYNVAADPAKRAEMVELTGQLGVPVIIFDKTDAFVGFNKKLVADKLGIDLSADKPTMAA